MKWQGGDRHSCPMLSGSVVSDEDGTLIQLTLTRVLTVVARH